MNSVFVRHCGVMTYWAAGDTERAKLIPTMNDLGLADYVPEQRSDSDALKAAIRDYCKENSSGEKRDKLVQGLKKPKRNGFQVLEVERREDDNDYNKSFGAKVEDGRVIVTRGCADDYTLQKTFERLKGISTGSSVSAMLAEIATRRFGATMLGPRLWWIPDEHVQEWRNIADRVSDIAMDGDTAVTSLTYLMDDNGVEAIKDAIIDEVFEIAEKLKKEIADNDLGRTALTSRQIVAASLHARVSKYEAILGEALTALHQVVQTAEEAAASAIAVVDSEEAFAGVF